MKGLHLTGRLLKLRHLLVEFVLVAETWRLAHLGDLLSFLFQGIQCSDMINTLNAICFIFVSLFSRNCSVSEDRACW